LSRRADGVYQKVRTTMEEVRGAPGGRIIVVTTEDVNGDLDRVADHVLRVAAHSTALVPAAHGDSVCSSWPITSPCGAAATWIARAKTWRKSVTVE